MNICRAHDRADYYHYFPYRVTTPVCTVDRQQNIQRTPYKRFRALAYTCVTLGKRGLTTPSHIARAGVLAVAPPLLPFHMFSRNAAACVDGTRFAAIASSDAPRLHWPLRSLPHLLFGLMTYLLLYSRLFAC